MGNTNTTAELQQLLEAFINDPNKRFDEVQEYLIKINTRLTAIFLSIAVCGASMHHQPNNF